LLRDDGLRVAPTGQQECRDARWYGGGDFRNGLLGNHARSLGMAETSPSAAAPWRIASTASATFLMQQIFTRGVVIA